jgi:hypothetical protein
MTTKEELEEEIKALEAELREREASLPAHSVRPQQMIAIEALEKVINEKKIRLEALRAEKTSQ